MSLQVHRFPHINHKPFLKTLDRLNPEFNELKKPHNRLKDLYPHPDSQPRFLIPLAGFRKDFIWDIEMENAIEEGVEKLDHDCFNSAESLLDFLAEKYRDYVNKRPVNMSENYITKAGRWRKKDEGERCSIIRDARLPYENRANALTGTEKGTPGEHIMTEKINGIPIELTRTRKTKENPAQTEWIYTKPLISFSVVLPHIEDLFQEFLKLKNHLNKNNKYRTEENLNKATKHIAEVHWWLAHGMFFYRGNAGIADMYTKILFDSLGIDVESWKNISPDMEAFVTPLDEYIKNYPDFFMKRPNFISLQTHYSYPFSMN